MRGGPREKSRDICVVPGDFQTADVVVTSLPTRTQAGTPASSLFGGKVFGWLIPLGDYAGAAWNRSGRSSTGDGSTVPAVPLVSGKPIVVSPSREVYLRQSSLVTAVGTISLVFIPAEREEDIDDPYLLAAIAQGYGAEDGSSGSTSPVLPNRSTSRTQGAITNAGNTTITWAQAGFMYATVVNRGPGIVLIGSSGAAVVFPLYVGTAENYYVGNSTGFLVIGQSAVTADTIDWIEYGRV